MFTALLECKQPRLVISKGMLLLFMNLLYVYRRKQYQIMLGLPTYPTKYFVKQSSGASSLL